jgi:hypothetical protein
MIKAERGGEGRFTLFAGHLDIGLRKPADRPAVFIYTVKSVKIRYYEMLPWFKQKPAAGGLSLKMPHITDKLNYAFYSVRPEYQVSPVEIP